MDIPIKLKACEKAAIDYINEKAPELYREKNPGFRWAANMAANMVAQSPPIDWEKISKLRIKNQISADGFADDNSSISHLTIADQDYEKLKADMDQQLGMSRGVQKAFLARTIIKWGMQELDRQVETTYSSLIMPMKQKLTNTDALKLCVDLFCDSLEEDFEKRNIQEEVKKILLEYQERLAERDQPL